MVDLDLGADLEAYTRDAARAADVAAARAFGFGGEYWSASRPSGSGPAARTMSAVSGVRLLAYRTAPAGLRATSAGVPIGGEEWRYLLLSGVLRVGDQIQSLAGSAYVFSVASREPWYDHDRGRLEILG